MSCWHCGARRPFLRFRARLGRVLLWECPEHEVRGEEPALSVHGKWLGPERCGKWP